MAQPISLRYGMDRVRQVFGPHGQSAWRVLSATDADANGKLFLSPEGQLFRGITSHSQPFFRRILDSGLIDSLAQKGLLVETSVSDQPIEGYPLVVEHRRIRYVSYPSEWTPLMLREAALGLLALQAELSGHGMQLHDAHSRNMLFDGTRPVWVDLGSLEPAAPNELWAACDEFCRSFLHPLAISTSSYSREARMLVHDYLNGVPEAMVMGLCPQLAENWSHSSYSTMEANERNRRALIDTLQREISEIPLPRRTTDWSEYYNGTPSGIEPSDGWRHKQRTFYEILQRIQPETLVDIGSNRGLYGQMAARLGISVAAFDRDETAVGDLYEDARNRSLPITPLVCDLMNPTPAQGINYHWFPSVYDRLRSEMAIALALVHHLVFKMWLNFEQIVSSFADFAGKWLLVEFIPREDQYVSQWITPDHDWYTLPRFVDALKKHFRRIETLPSDPEPRLFLLCER